MQEDGLTRNDVLTLIKTYAEDLARRIAISMIGDAYQAIGDAEIEIYLQQMSALTKQLIEKTPASLK